MRVPPPPWMAQALPPSPGRVMSARPRETTSTHQFLLLGGMNLEDQDSRVRLRHAPGAWHRVTTPLQLQR